MDPVSSLIGSLLLGFGTLLLVGAIKNRRVLGRDGLLTTAIAKGSITPASETPEAFPVSGTEAGKVAVRAKRGPDETRDAVDAIATVNRSLANGIGAQLELVDESSTRTDLMPLAQLLAIADAQGFTVSVAAIRAYIKDLTDETI